MDHETRPPAALRFGAYELDLTAGQLRRSGIHIRLRPQAFRVLALLASRAGHVVTRDELRKELWGDDTFVDFAQGLNFCIRQVRVALGDDAATPHVVETIPRRGYRFLLPVTPLPLQSSLSPDNASPTPTATVVQPGWPFAAALVVLVVVTGVLLFNRERGDLVHMAPTIPLTTYPGSERHPAVSPDGQHVAFSWNGPAQDNVDIYVKPIGSGDPRRLTTEGAEDISPAWSPDGLAIAFLRRQDEDRLALVIMRAFGGPEQKVTELDATMRLPSLAWSPSGEWLVTSLRERQEENDGLFLVSPRTGRKVRLTEPPRGFSGDYMPAFSPNGRSVAFARLSGWSASEIYVLPLADDGTAKEARALTREGRWSTSPVWTRDGRSIVYLSGDSGGRFEMRRLSATDRAPSERLADLEGDAFQLSLGQHLVYSRETSDTNIWRTTLDAADAPPGTEEVFVASTRHDWHPRYSPDGRKIAFGSTRTGSREIWLADVDGSDAVQLTAFRGPHVGFMNWSPDSRRLVFHARPEGQADLFTIPATSGGTSVQLTTHPADDVTPSYSHDGRWIYFASLRSGQWEAWKMPSTGGDAKQISFTGGVEMPLESPDGKWVYYCIPANGIWKVPADGGDGLNVTGPIAAACAFAVADDGLYYAGAPDSDHDGVIRFLSFATLHAANRDLGPADGRGLERFT